MTNRDVGRYLYFTPAQMSRQGATELFDFAMHCRGRKGAVQVLAIASRRDSRFMGLCGLSPCGKRRQRNCFYALLPRYWGNGFAAEAMTALLRYGFEKLQLSGIRADAHPANVRSHAVSRRIGMHKRDCRSACPTGCIQMHFFMTRRHFSAAGSCRSVNNLKVER